MTIERINGNIEKNHTSFMANLVKYAEEMRNSGKISDKDSSQINISLADHNVKDLLWLSAKMLLVEKPLDFIQAGIVGKTLTSGGAALPVWATTEGIKSAAMLATVASDQKYTGSKTLLYPLSVLPGIGGLAPLAILYKDHRPLFRLVRSYLFSRHNFSNGTKSITRKEQAQANMNGFLRTQQTINKTNEQTQKVISPNTYRQNNQNTSTIASPQKAYTTPAQSFRMSG